jgi:hypothetical protein
MKSLDLDWINAEVQDQGFSITRGYLDARDIQDAKEFTDHLTGLYSNRGLNERLFYKREESGNRQGDAVMVSRRKPFRLPSLCTDSGLLENYHLILGKLTGKKVPVQSRSMMNMQKYYDTSFEVCEHYDGFYSKFHHGEVDKHGECPLIIDEGLIPRYVQVVVLENENDGKGVYVRAHDSGKRVDVELFPGDMLIFDNVNMRHGVPELKYPRRMLGFRNFDHMPYHFKRSVENDEEGFTPLYDDVNPGYIKPIFNDESLEIQVQELKEWKSGKSEEQLKKPAAF